MSRIEQADPAGQRRGMGASGRLMRSARERLELVVSRRSPRDRSAVQDREASAFGRLCLKVGDSACMAGRLR